MELTRVKVADLRANEINPRTRFDGLKELADSFDLNPMNPGEPMTPIIAFRDANVVRIIDGERRYRAMKKHKTAEECWCVLCDDPSEADAAIAMLATDMREQLSDENKGAHFQTMLALGVPEETIDKAAGRPVAKTLRRHRERTGGKVDMVSIEQLLAAEEVADNEEDYRAVMDAKGDGWNGTPEWERVFDGIKRRREHEAEQSEIEAAVDAAVTLGLKVADKAPRGALRERSLAMGSVAEQIIKNCAEWAEAGMVLVRPKERWDHWEVYTPAAEVTEEEQAEISSRNALRRAESLARKERIAWIWNRYREAGMEGLPNTWRIVEKRLRNRYFGNSEKFCAAAGVDGSNLDIIPTLYNVASCWVEFDHMTNDEIDCLPTGELGWHGSSPFEHHLEVMAALEADGYKQGEAEAEVTALCELIVANCADDGDDGDEDGEL